MAASVYMVESVSEYWPNPSNPCWRVDMVKPDGTGHTYVFPKVTLENTAAEYGIDPTDVDELLDIAMHLPFTPMPNDPHEEDAAEAMGMVSPALRSLGTIRAGQMIGTTLYTAKNTAEARAAHKARIDQTKANRVVVVSRNGKKDPLDVIRANHGVDPERVRVKAEKVNERRLMAQGKLRMKSRTEEFPLKSRPGGATK